MPFERLAQLRLQHAIEDGLLDDLPNQGQPLDLDEYFAAPEDVRAAYAILKNANCLPEEVELRAEIAALERRLAQTVAAESRRTIESAIADRTLRLDILRERARRAAAASRTRPHP